MSANSPSKSLRAPSHVLVPPQRRTFPRERRMSSASELPGFETEPGSTADRPYPGGIPEATVARHHDYLHPHRMLAERGVSTVASDQPARAACLNSAKSCEDLSHLSSYGIRGL